jgi:hypothetical protein
MMKLIALWLRILTSEGDLKTATVQYLISQLLGYA